MKRGEIWWVDTGDNVGSELSFTRPVLIVQADIINRSTFHTVIVAGLTSNLKYADIPGNVFIPKKEGFLPKDSVVVGATLASIDKTRFREKLCDLPDLWMDQVEFSLSLVLDLS